MSVKALRSQKLTTIMGYSLDVTDVLLLIGVSLATFTYFYQKSRSPRQSAAESHLAQLSRTLAEQKEKQLAAQAAKPSYDGLVDQMEKTNKDVVIFFGSQTGTAEDFASRLAKEAGRYGFKAMTADPEEFEMGDIESLPEDKLAIFIMATYGEGEPTDNAITFHEYLENTVEEKKDDKPMSKLTYAIFGAGNKTYELFNEEARFVDTSLTTLGGTRIGERGEGDDDANIEEDFVQWKSATFLSICKFFNVSPDTLNAQAAVEKEFTLIELPDYSIPKNIYKGELKETTSAARLNSINTNYDLKNPFYAPIRVSHELFDQAAQPEKPHLRRHCLHQEIDIMGSGMKYQAGDHIGIWPTNDEEQVMKLAKVLGLLEKDENGKLRLDKVIDMTADDPDARKKHPFPCPTTYRVAFKHYLDISVPAKSHNLELYNAYIKPSESGTEEDAKKAKEELKKLIDDKDLFQKDIVEAHMTVADLLEAHPEVTIPAGVVLESFSRLQCRYYSISSSGKVFPQNVHVTASVLRYESQGEKAKVVKGVCTNYLYDIHERLQKGEDPDDMRVPCYIRHSNFHLPSDGRPIVMIGPGTGVAPFRGFVQDIAYEKVGKDAEPVKKAAVVDQPGNNLTNGHQATNGVNTTGFSKLYFGCRNQKVDFLYRHEWPLYSSLSGLELSTAFSRDGDKKVYVQDRLKEEQDAVWDILTKQNGNVYVCGDAKNMAREVNQFFVDLCKKEMKVDEEKAQKWVKDLRNGGRYLEDVWS